MIPVSPAEAGIQYYKIMERIPCVYILASKRNGTLYTGVTSNLIQRIYQHRNMEVDGFTKEHLVHQLVWYELHETMASAILREKRIKSWKRLWKLRIIEEMNPEWENLYLKII